MFVELTVPLGGLGLLEGDALPEGTRVEFERTASVGGCGSSTLLISGGVRAAETAVRESRFVADVTRVGETDHETVYRITWDEPLPELLDRVHDVDGTVLTAVATDDAWTVALRFRDPDAASRFHTHYDDHTHPITIRRMRPDQAQQGPGDALSPAQREALGRALEAGYFDVPRQVSLCDLADELDISDSAVSQRLRRGLSNYLRTTPHERSPVVHQERADD